MCIKSGVLPGDIFAVFEVTKGPHPYLHPPPPHVEGRLKENTMLVSPSSADTTSVHCPPALLLVYFSFSLCSKQVELELADRIGWALSQIRRRGHELGFLLILILPVFRIRDIFIRIRILGSVLLTNGSSSGSCSSRQ